MNDDSIRNIPRQFGFNPEVIHFEKLPQKPRFVLGGMGGSHLCGELFNALFPEVPLLIHKGYGIPILPPSDMSEVLFIASSFSGETEETLSFAKETLSKNLPLAVIAGGGKLLSLAETREIPHVHLQGTEGLEPRQSTFLFLGALLKLAGKEPAQKEMSSVGDHIDIGAMKIFGERAARNIGKKIPLLYSSIENRCVPQNWKVKLNETSKIPAFTNVFSEQNHNEIEIFRPEYASNFHVILFRDTADHPRIQKRMDIFVSMIRESGFSCDEIFLEGEGGMEKLFRSIIIGEWAAQELAEMRGLHSYETPIIAEFKEKLKDA